MAIKRKANAPRFTIINNGVLKESHLSFQAMGLLTYLLSKPDKWQVSPIHLSKVTIGTAKPTGRDGVYAILKELVNTGYIHRERQSTGEMDYIVYDEPNQRFKPHTDYTDKAEKPHTDNPDLDKPDTDNPDLAKPTQVNTDLKVSTEVEVNTDSLEKTDQNLSLGISFFELNLEAIANFAKTSEAVEGTLLEIMDAKDMQAMKFDPFHVWRKFVIHHRGKGSVEFSEDDVISMWKIWVVRELQHLNVTEQRIYDARARRA